MRDSLALPIICATKLCTCSSWLVHLKVIMNHSRLDENEKYLWLWLATQSADNKSLSCSFTYEQISKMVNKTPRNVHRILFRLKLMGFLQANIPIWYGDPTDQMLSEMRLIKLILPQHQIKIEKNLNL